MEMLCSNLYAKENKLLYFQHMQCLDRLYDFICEVSKFTKLFYI